MKTNCGIIKSHPRARWDRTETSPRCLGGRGLWVDERLPVGAIFEYAHSHTFHVAYVVYGHPFGIYYFTIYS